MKKLIKITGLLSSIFFVSTVLSTNLSAQPRALVVLADQFGANTHFNLDNMAESGYSITLAGATRQVTSCTFAAGIGNQVFTVDTLLTEITSSNPWDLIAIMPMEWRNSQNPYGDLIACTAFMSILKEARQQGKIIWATCAGVRVLAAANIINGVKVSGRSEYSQEYTDAGANYLGANIPPVCDQNIITSTRGMYYMQENIEMISTAFEKSGKNLNWHQNVSMLSDISQSDLEIAIWNHQFKSEASQGIRSVCRTPDGGHLATGYTWANPGQNSDLLLIRTDIMGNLVWSKSIGDAGWEFGWSVIATRDGGYVAAGYSSSSRAMDKNIYIIKTDTDGNLLWERQLGGGGSDVARDVTESDDGSLIIAGYTDQTSSGEWDLVVAKLDQSGEYLWTRIFGADGPEIARSVIQNSDGNFVLAGETGSTTNGNRDMLLLCIDPDGTKLWEKTYHKDNYDSGYEVIEQPGGGYYLIGHGDTHGQDFLELAVVKTDANGHCLSHTLYEATTRFYDYGKSVAISPNGSLAFCGVAKKKNTRENKLFLILLDPDGRSLMNNWFDLEGSSWCTSLIAGADNNFVAAGQSTRDNHNYCPWLFKIQNPMVAGTAENQPLNEGHFRCFPSPFTDHLLIRTDLNGNEPGAITILDLMGNIVNHWFIDNYNNSKQTWYGNKHSGEPADPGFYIVRYATSSYTGYQKVLYLH